MYSVVRFYNIFPGQKNYDFQTCENFSADVENFTGTINLNFIYYLKHHLLKVLNRYKIS